MLQATIISGFASRGAHVLALANYLHLGNVLETTYIEKKDSKSAPLWSPVPLWYRHKLMPLIHVMETFDYFLQNSNSAYKS